jgi:hypothetical protein
VEAEMNERIQELLIEAHKQTNGGIYNGHLSEWTEKFAELIIKDCLSIADNRGAYQVMDDIIEHFGVEL